MDPQTKNDSDKTQDIHIPFDPLTAHKIVTLIKQLLCQFEGLVVFNFMQKIKIFENSYFKLFPKILIFGQNLTF